jgi:hypothetical protein
VPARGQNRDEFPEFPEFPGGREFTKSSKKTREYNKKEEEFLISYTLPPVCPKSAILGLFFFLYTRAREFTE